MLMHLPAAPLREPTGASEPWALTEWPWLWLGRLWLQCHRPWCSTYRNHRPHGTSLIENRDWPLAVSLNIYRHFTVGETSTLG